MKIEFAKITQALDLGDYYEPYRGTVIQVWVNPTWETRKWRDRILQRLAKCLGELSVLVSESGKPAEQKKNKGAVYEPSLQELQREPLPDILDKRKEELQKELQKEAFSWLAELWSQSAKEESHWSVDEIDILFNTDPKLYEWLMRRSVEMIEQFRSDEKKPDGRGGGGEADRHDLPPDTGGRAGR
jgi:hypothetical protein